METSSPSIYRDLNGLVYSLKINVGPTFIIFEKLGKIWVKFGSLSIYRDLHN
jgi:hypothetical protein